MDIAIVGGGLAALSCGRSLQLQGHHVVVYESQARVGGRMSACATAQGDFDHGAQYFTVRTEPFAKVVAAWRQAGWVAQWRARLVALHRGAARDAGDTRPRMVAVPTMNGLCLELACGLDVRLRQHVTGLERFGDKWLLRLQAPAVSVGATGGPYDAVVAAIPSAAAATLLTPHTRLAEPAGQVSNVPCWALMLAFDRPLGLDYQGAWVHGSPVAWLAHEPSRPSRGGGERWLVQATPDWSSAHLDDLQADVLEQLYDAFCEATGTQAMPTLAQVHCWRVAQVPVPMAGEFIWDPAQRLGACGDWLACGLEGGGKIENAWISGTRLAAEMQ